MWDDEVDLVCVGAGIGGLAGAIAMVDAGYGVLVVEPTEAPEIDGANVGIRRPVHGWLRAETADPETSAYLAALAHGLPSTSCFTPKLAIPTRVASTLTSEATVEPFVGSRLTDWAAQCLTSPYGLLYSRVIGWSRTTMRAADGGTIAVVPVGTVGGSGPSSITLRGWMTDQARERDIDILDSGQLQRLVFEDGRILGAVFATADGPLAIRARFGVTISPTEQDSAGVDAGFGASGPKQVCVVGRTASRFGRVELLSLAPEPTTRPMCTGSRQALRGLRESRPIPSDAWRYGKVHRYPTLDQ